MVIIGAYLLIDTLSGKFYVGSTKNVTVRFNRHSNDLRQNKHHCKPLQDIWNNGATLIFIPLGFETREEAYCFEQFMIKQYASSPLLLNIGLGVIGGDNLTNHPDRDSIIAKMKNSLLERFSTLTAQERNLIYGRPGKLNGMFGRTHTPEVRRKLSEQSKGNTYCLGIKRSDKFKEMCSLRAQLRTGDKNPFYGKEHSVETKEKLSRRNKGKLPINLRPVVINSKEFASVTEASRQLHVCPATILFRISSPNPKFKDYFYKQQ
jgi:group I intron endonuclease